MKQAGIDLVLSCSTHNVDMDNKRIPISWRSAASSTCQNHQLNIRKIPRIIEVNNQSNVLNHQNVSSPRKSSAKRENTQTRAINI